MKATSSNDMISLAIFLVYCSSEYDEYSDPASAGARLSTPENASISRKRKVKTDLSQKKRIVRGSVDPNVSAWDRVNEFKDQCLNYSVGKSKM